MRFLLAFIGLLLAGASGCEVPVGLCESQRDCFGGEVCVDGECLPSVAGITDASNNDSDAGGANGDSGSNPASCRAGGEDPCGKLVCNVSTGLCEGCQRDVQCDAGELCDIASGQCVCDANHHDCGGVCLRNDSPDSCGSSCEPCPSAENADAVCNAGTCGLVCSDGFEPCDDCGFQRSCVECRINNDCGSYGAARCDQGLCVPCGGDADCTHLDRGICLEGTCVECDVGKETPCGGNSCNPATNLCTETDQRSLPWCFPCVADSECQPNHRCVPMFFQDSPRPGGYCLLEADFPCGVPNPIRVQRTSLSGVAGEFYCTIREDLTTCEGVRALEDRCTQDNDCGAENVGDGVCAFDECTYRCVEDEECSSGTRCIGNPPDNSYCARL